jgi:hypothetical protein
VADVALSTRKVKIINENFKTLNPKWLEDSFHAQIVQKKSCHRKNNKGFLHTLPRKTNERYAAAIVNA